MSVEIGDKNRNGQILVEKTNRRGNHPFAKIWILRCPDKQHHGNRKEFTYRANSCDFHIRKCPKTDSRIAPGI
jgi:hypothetical protein